MPGVVVQTIKSTMQNRGMTNLANTLKSEIARIARKEMRTELDALKKSVGAYRSEIAALKRRAHALEQELRRVARVVPKPAPKAVIEPSGRKTHFDAKGLSALRQRLGLSAHEIGLLIGTSGQSVYNWEAGSIRPREKYLPAIAALKAMGKKAVHARLADIAGDTRQ